MRRNSTFIFLSLALALIIFSLLLFSTTFSLASSSKKRGGGGNSFEDFSQESLDDFDYEDEQNLKERIEAAGKFKAAEEQEKEEEEKRKKLLKEKNENFDLQEAAEMEDEGESHLERALKRDMDKQKQQQQEEEQKHENSEQEDKTNVESDSDNNNEEESYHDSGGSGLSSSSSSSFESDFLYSKNPKSEPLLLIWYAPFLGFGGYKAEALEFVSAIYRNLLEPFGEQNISSSFTRKNKKNFDPTTTKPNRSLIGQQLVKDWNNLSKWVSSDAGAIEEKLMDSSASSSFVEEKKLDENEKNKNENNNKEKPQLQVKAFACLHHGDSMASQSVDYHSEEFQACSQSGKKLALSNPAVPELWSTVQPHPSRMIVVCHSGQGMWSFPRSDYPTVVCPPSVHPVRARIGRTMFETDRVPASWKRRLMKMDEIWVPTEFHKKVFSRTDLSESETASIPVEKLRVIPEPIDTELWRRDDNEVIENYYLQFGEDVGEFMRVPVEARMTRNRLTALTMLSGVDIEPFTDAQLADVGPSFDRIPGITDEDSDPQTDDENADERHKPSLGLRDNMLASLLSYRLWSRDVIPQRGTMCLNSKVFVSTFKRERRKGWDILVRAFIESFGSRRPSPQSNGPPCLILHTTEYAEQFPLDFPETLDLFTKFLYADHSDDENSENNENSEHSWEEDEKQDEILINITFQQEQMDAEVALADRVNAKNRARPLQLIPDRVSAARLALHQRKEMRREMKERPDSYRNFCKSMCNSLETCSFCDTVADSPKKWRRHMRNRLEVQDVPLFLFTQGPLPFQQYRDLIALSDVSVLTTRGEGWARPVQEAMSLAVPSIVTNWSGPTAFSRPEFSFLIPIDEKTQLREVPEDLWFAGHKWAEPSVDDVRNLLIRAEMMHLSELIQMGIKAREYVVEHLDVSVVGKMILEAAAEVAEKKEFL